MESVASFTNPILHLQERKAKQRAVPLPRKETEPRIYTTFNCLSYPGPYTIGSLQCFQCITHSFLPNNAHALLPPIKLHGAKSILKGRRYIAQLARNSLHLRHPRLSQPMQLVLWATWVQFICLNTRTRQGGGEKTERQDCHLCGSYVKNVHLLPKMDVKIPGQVAVNRVL